MMCNRASSAFTADATAQILKKIGTLSKTQWFDDLVATTDLQKVNLLNVVKIGLISAQSSKACLSDGLQLDTTFQILSCI